MKIIKFGGTSLANGKGINQVVSIISDKYSRGEKIAVVVSARANATDQLIDLLQQAKDNLDYTRDLENFKKCQSEGVDSGLFETEFSKLEKLLEGVYLLEDFSEKIKDNVLATGELIAARYVAELLKQYGINANFVDSRALIITDNVFGNAQPVNEISALRVKDFFEKNQDKLNIITGFIGATQKGETTTLGRNGSNYTASLFANYLSAEEFQNYTHVDGIFTANPDLVKDAKRIEQLSFEDANELANFGANILHAKTIIPLVEKKIPLRILNTFNPDSPGTLISAEPTVRGIKSLSVLNDTAFIEIEGRGLLGRSDIDSRVFGTMSKNRISVSIISQGSSERGLGFVIDKNRANDAVKALKAEFAAELYNRDINTIRANDDISVVSIVGQDLSTFHKPYNALIKNGIVPIVFNNAVSGKNISLLVKKDQLIKALNVIHGQIFGISKKINIAVFGHGLVGGTLIGQILNSADNIESKKGIKLNIFAVANSKKVLLNQNGIGSDWEEQIKEKGKEYRISDIIEFAKENNLENLVAIDNTASKVFVESYLTFATNGFDLISSNKIANTLLYDYYKTLRETLAKNQKNYLYETNVGAGLPLIDTIKLLHLSGENITGIRGVFSGSLSYIFNNFSVQEKPFHLILKEAIAKGYTEPDPREDLSGNDVARKLLILARELELENEFDEIKIQSLIPENLQDVSTEEFLDNLEKLNERYDPIKSTQQQGYVWRYIGELSGNLQESKGILEVKLVSVPENSALGGLKGSDSLFEIYTESYGEQPIVIQGAGAGALVTARGVFGDILRLASINS